MQREECQQVPKQECQTVPRQQCNPVQRQSCQTVPRQNCQQIPKQDCQQVGDCQCYLWYVCIPHGSLHSPGSSTKLPASTEAKLSAGSGAGAVSGLSISAQTTMSKRSTSTMPRCKFQFIVFFEFTLGNVIYHSPFLLYQVPREQCQSVPTRVEEQVCSNIPRQQCQQVWYYIFL